MRPTGPNRYFPKVKEAQEALKSKALELHNLYMMIIQAAISKGDLEVAMKATQWLMEHTPAQDGVRMVASSVDKQVTDTGRNNGPAINIGFQLGGLGETRSLPPAVTVDAEAIEEGPTED